jgi:hypothetical protein
LSVFSTPTRTEKRRRRRLVTLNPNPKSHIIQGIGSPNAIKKLSKTKQKLRKSALKSGTCNAPSCDGTSPPVLWFWNMQCLARLQMVEDL